MNAEPVMNLGFDNKKFTNNTKEIIDFLPSSYTLLNDFDFEVTYRNYTENLWRNKVALVLGADREMFNLYDQFDDDTFGERTGMPYRFGSYLLYETNNITKNFKVVNYVNTTSQDVAIAYP